jgi:hypothetical protein
MIFAVAVSWPISGARAQMDGYSCAVSIPSQFTLFQSKSAGKHLVHRHMRIVALSSCLDGRGPLRGLDRVYKKPGYKILRNVPKLLVVEFKAAGINNRTIVVGNSRWRQFTMIFKDDTPAVREELDAIQKELAVMP